MNKKTYLLSVLVFQLCLLSSCRVIQLSSLHPEGALPKKLPGLQITNGFNKPLNPNYAMYATNSIYRDADVLFDRYIQDNITNSIEEKYGYAEFKTILGQNGYRGWGWYALSIATLGVPNLLGMPLLNATTNLEVELNILNSEKKIIGKYTGKGYAKIPVALYYGYNTLSALRVANVNAIKMALKSISQQIEKDSEILNSKLIEGGKIR